MRLFISRDKIMSYHIITSPVIISEFITLEYISDDTKGKWEHATLKIHAPSTGAKVSLNGKSTHEAECSETIEIKVIGNWEAMGFADALIELGEKLTKEIKH